MRVALLALVLLLVGCTHDPGVVIDDPVLEPYDGPLHVAFDDAEYGAAGLALGCQWNPQDGGVLDVSATGDDPEAAFAAWLGAEAPVVPDSGYQLEQVENGRALFSFVQVLSRVVVVILAEVESGWGVESWAACDPSELGVDTAESLGVGVWTGPGRPQVTSEVVTFRGSESCGMQGTPILRVGLDEYVRDGSSGLPAGAVNRELQRDGRTLWLGEHPRAAYLVPGSGSEVQRWPALDGPTGCDFRK
ncbi:hypothetical protein [Nocardioides sp. SR21]|uniref:hypothetical protein n=1 Tax=Nocardioides sp. SR21 TaxID=2919501 RepID=UPI001FA99D44|nr:hypothetical protein [Nocardioides sp. SR21]